MKLRLALCAALLSVAAPLAAQEAEAGPIEVEAVYTAEVWRSEDGVEEGWRYLDNLDLTLAADLEHVAGIPDTRAFAYVLYNNGASLTELTGDALTASNIETGVRALRLYEAWIEHDFAPGASLRAGLYDLNSEFDALESSELFIGSAHGIGPDISQTGENGPSIFPVTSLAARLAVAVSDTLTVRAAVLDAVPGDPARPARTAIELGDGALAIAEADWTFGPVRLLGGGWRYSRQQDRVDGLGLSRSQGAYLRGEACLAGGEQCSLNGFARIGMASQATNPFETFASAGLVLHLAAGTQAGLAVAHADGSRTAQSDPEAVFGETAFELTIAHRLLPQIILQPNFQRVVSHSRAFRRSASVFGLRVSFAPF